MSDRKYVSYGKFFDAEKAKEHLPKYLFYKRENKTYTAYSKFYKNKHE